MYCQHLWVATAVRRWLCGSRRIEPCYTNIWMISPNCAAALWGSLTTIENITYLHTNTRRFRTKYLWQHLLQTTILCMVLILAVIKYYCLIRLVDFVFLFKLCRLHRTWMYIYTRSWPVGVSSGSRLAGVLCCFHACNMLFICSQISRPFVTISGDNNCWVQRNVSRFSIPPASIPPTFPAQSSITASWNGLTMLDKKAPTGFWGRRICA